MALRSRALGSQTSPQLDGQKSKHAPSSTKTRKGRRKIKRKLLFLALLFIVPLFTVYAVVPVLIRSSSWIQQALIFVHHVKIPYYANISNPTEFGLRNAREFVLRHDGDGCEVEVWHVLPKTYGHSEEHDYIAALSDGAPIILYLHGNTGTRATFHRVQVYKFLAEQRGYHVITFDYRGFGNSLCFPSERGMMEDGFLVWNWIKKNTPANSSIYVWGHSLGSAAATYLTKELSHHSIVPSGLVLDAPFTNIIEAAMSHPFSIPYWPIREIFRFLVLEAFEERFESDTRLGHISCPVLILHGQGDFIVPFDLGKKLYDVAIESRKANPDLGDVRFVDCGNTTHKTNILSPHIHMALDSFIERH